MRDNWQWSFDTGKAARLEAEAQARMHQQPFNASQVPMHSRDATMQSYFKKGWCSVRIADVHQHINPLASFVQLRAQLQQHNRGVK